MRDIVEAASKDYHDAPKWLYGIVACANHVDREAVILFEKPGKQFAYCAMCAKRTKGGRFVSLVVEHGHTARPINRTPVTV